MLTEVNAKLLFFSIFNYLNNFLLKMFLLLMFSISVVSVCKNSLAQGGFFCKDGGYYCTKDYQTRYGTKCAICGEYVEGEVVSALGNTYHQKCFTCARCRYV